MRKISRLLLNTVMIVGSLVMLTSGMKVQAATEVGSGTCGSSVNWSLDSEGVLTISGSGEMDNYTSPAGWYPHDATIKKVVIESGVTKIGSNAFTNCTAIKSVSISNSVEEIASSAFYGCSGLTSINLPEDLKIIGAYAFKYSGLKSITIPSKVTRIGGEAFKECSQLNKVIIEDADKFPVAQLEGSAFDNSPVSNLEIRSGDVANVKNVIQRVFCHISGRDYKDIRTISSDKSIKVPETLVAAIDEAIPNVTVQDSSSSSSSSDSDSDSDSDKSSKSSSSSKSSNKEKKEKKEDKPADPPASRVEADAMLNELAAEIASLDVDAENIDIVSKYYYSFSKEFMTKLQNEKLAGKTVYLEFDYLGRHYVVSIPGGPDLNVELDWYGPLKLMSLFPTTSSVLTH